MTNIDMLGPESLQQAFGMPGIAPQLSHDNAALTAINFSGESAYVSDLNDDVMLQRACTSSNSNTFATSFDEYQSQSASDSSALVVACSYDGAANTTQPFNVIAIDNRDESFTFDPDDEIIYNACLVVENNHRIDPSRDPKSFTEAVTSILSDKWINAMDSELQSIIEHETWSYYLRDALPEGTKPLTTKWVYKTKRDELGQIARHKARLCVRGFLQKYGINYHETYAPTVRYATQRIAQAIAATLGYEASQLDVSNAFLYGTVKEDIFIEQPERYHDPAHPHDKFVLKLNKALYGIKQAPREWHAEVSKFLIHTLNFTSNPFEPCWFIKRSATSCLIMLTLYVDDITYYYAPCDADEVKQFVLQFSQKIQSHTTHSIDTHSRYACNTGTT